MSSNAALQQRLPGLALRVVVAGGVGAATTAAALAVGASPREAAIFAIGVLALAIVFSLLENAAIARAVDVGRRLAGLDELTDLPSGAVAEHFVATEYAAAQRGRSVTLVVFGLDGLDAFTATHGAAAADTSVREFAQLLKRLTRRMNLSARYGWRADVFVSVLSDADASGAERFVQRVRAGMDAVAAVVPMPPLSVGIAEMDQDIASPEEFVERAELALGEARAAGGNCSRVRRAQRPDPEHAGLQSL